MTRKGRPGRAQPSEAPILRFTGAIVVIGALVVGTITVLAVWRPGFFENGQVRRPSGTLTPSEQIALDKARVDARNNTRDTGLKVAAGFGALAAALLAWGRIELSRAERRLDQAGHFTERYSKAVEQLGHGSPEVQLGGIYALEQLGIDSAEHRRTVVEVLCAFVREHGGLVERGPERVDANAEDDVPKAELPRLQVGRQPVTVQASVNVLQRNHAQWDDVSYDLGKADLRGANLVGADLGKANLSGADLRRADLRRADLGEGGPRGGGPQGGVPQ